MNTHVNPETDQSETSEEQQAPRTSSEPADMLTPQSKAREKQHSFHDEGDEFLTTMIVADKIEDALCDDESDEQTEANSDSSETGTDTEPTAGGSESANNDSADDGDGGDGDSDASETIYIMLAITLAGGISAAAGIIANDGNSQVCTGAYIYLAGYCVLLLRILPFYLVLLGSMMLFTAIGIGDKISVYFIGISAALLLTGGIGYLIRYLVPQRIMSILKKFSWVLMAGGPALMILGGAIYTGAICLGIAGIWYLIFAIGYIMKLIMEKFIRPKVEPWIDNVVVPWIDKIFKVDK